MRSATLHAKSLLVLLEKKKIATLPELKRALGTQVSMTVFRKIKQLDYMSSCSHSGKYYTLRRIAHFTTDGLWRCKSVLFSSHGSLINTVNFLIEKSEMGYTAGEVEKLLKLKPNEALICLIKAKGRERNKLDISNLMA